MLNSLSLKNFKCFYGEHFIQFPEGLINVRGRINGNEELSNRSGKSSFLEAIRFALFREPAYKYVSLDEADLTVDLCINENYLRHNESSSFVNNEKVLIAASKAASESLIGLDEQMFLCTVGAFSDNLYGFLELKPKEQKELLLNNFNDSSYVWEDMQSVLRDKVEEINNKRNTIKMRISMLEERMSEVSVDMYEEKREELGVKLHSIDYEFKSRIESSEQYKNEYEYLVNALAGFNKTKDNFMFKKEKQIEKTKLLETINEKIHKLIKSLEGFVTVPAYDKRISQFTKEKHNIEFKLKDSTSKIQAYIDSNKKCPILNETCPYQEKLDTSFRLWEQDVSLLTSRLTDVKDSLVIEQEERNKVSRYNSELHTLNQDKFKLENDLKELETDTDIGVLLDNIEAAQNKLDYLKQVMDTAYISKLNADMYAVKEQLHTVNTILDDYWKANSEVKDLNEELFNIDTNLKSYTTALKLVSPRGIPYLLLTTVLEELESYTNKYLQSVDMKIYINGYMELKSLEDYCSNDGYKFKRNDIECPVCSSKRENKLQEEITVTSADTGVNWSQESSGGKALIALAMRFALLEMAKERKCTADFLILDEIFTNLDLRNKLAALEMIKSAAEHLDIKQVFIVTHDELKDIIPTTFIVNNVGGRSTIKQV